MAISTAVSNVFETLFLSPIGTLWFTGRQTGFHLGPSRDPDMRRRRDPNGLPSGVPPISVRGCRKGPAWAVHVGHSWAPNGAHASNAPGAHVGPVRAHSPYGPRTAPADKSGGSPERSAFGSLLPSRMGPKRDPLVAVGWVYTALWLHRFMLC